MTITEAITKAIEGGYSPDIWLQMWVKNPDTFEYDFEPYESALLDPFFWQALGKAMGWNKPITAEDRKNSTTLRRMHLTYWHALIDHLAEGKTIESYFETL